MFQCEATAVDNAMRDRIINVALQCCQRAKPCGFAGRSHPFLQAYSVGQWIVSHPASSHSFKLKHYLTGGCSHLSGNTPRDEDLATNKKTVRLPSSATGQTLATECFAVDRMPITRKSG